MSRPVAAQPRSQFIPWASRSTAGNQHGIEKAQQIAAHSNPKTTSLYDRTGDELSLDEIERVVI